MTFHQQGLIYMATESMNLIGPNWDIKTSIAVLQRIVIFYDYQRKIRARKNKQYVTFREELWNKKEAKYRKFCKKKMKCQRREKLVKHLNVLQFFSTFVNYNCLNSTVLLNIYVNEKSWPNSWKVQENPFSKNKELKKNKFWLWSKHWRMKMFKQF